VGVQKNVILLFILTKTIFKAIAHLLGNILNIGIQSRLFLSHSVGYKTGLHLMSNLCCISLYEDYFDISVYTIYITGIKAVKDGSWGTWNPVWMCGQGLDGATVGIIGLGRIGLAVGKCLKPFGVAKFLYSGHNPKPDAEQIGAEKTDLDSLLSKSDFVIGCCALTEENKHLFNAETFKKMKKNAIFINTSRGGLVNQTDLYQALKTGEILAAGLDVTSPEPLPTDSPLLTLDNCVILPHIGSATEKARAAMSELTARNILAVLQGKEMPCKVPI